MSADAFLTLGLCLGVLSIPMFLAAFADNRSPRVAIFAMLIAGACVAWAMTRKPGGYTLPEIPGIMIEVLASLVK